MLFQSLSAGLFMNEMLVIPLVQLLNDDSPAVQVFVFSFLLGGSEEIDFMQGNCKDFLFNPYVCGSVAKPEIWERGVGN